MPAFYCESMIEPFATDGWSIDFAAVSGDLRVQPVDAVEAPQETAILSLPYFGTPEALSGWLHSRPGRTPAQSSSQTRLIVCLHRGWHQLTTELPVFERCSPCQMARICLALHWRRRNVKQHLPPKCGSRP